MKAVKILSACAAFVLASAGVSAYEATAKVTMEGSLIKQTHLKDADPEYSAFTLDPIDDKSKNGIVIDADGGVAGAHFELFYIIDGTNKAEDGWSVSARKTHLWFKPVDMLKIRLGYVGDDTFFCERIDEEKVANPFNYVLREKGEIPLYITNADADEMGFSATLFPIKGLTLTAAIAPGIGKNGFINDDSAVTDGRYCAPWGVGAKYEVTDNIQVQLSYRDNGHYAGDAKVNNWKVVRAGVGIETDNLYAFFQPVFGIEYAKYENKDDAYEMNGIAFDVYGEYQLNAWKFTAHLPVTVRTTDKDSDPSYMEPLLMAEYNLGQKGLLDDVTPYLKLECFENVWTLDDNFSDTMNMNIQPGTKFSVGNCEIDLGFAVQVHSKVSTSERCTWAVPFTAKVEL